MFDFSIGVLLDSFRTDVETAMKQAAALGLSGIQVYATEGDMAPENMDTRRRKEFRAMADAYGLKISALCGDLGYGFFDPARNSQGIERSKRILELAKDLGAGALCIEGNINFYGKSGFVVAGTKGIRYHGEPEQEIVPYVLLKELQPGFLDDITGVYHTPKGYYVNEAAAEEFDRSFPPKEKLKLPGQLF